MLAYRGSARGTDEGEDAETKARLISFSLKHIRLESLATFLSLSFFPFRVDGRHGAATAR